MRNIQSKLDQLIQKECWAILSGIPNGSYIHLHFGEKIKRDKIIPNNKLEYGLDKYIGEYHIGIFCVWRLQKNGIPITSSSEPNGIPGPLVNGLKSIIGMRITSAIMVDECGDIQIDFGEPYLKVFCNYTGNEDPEYYPQNEINWFLRFRNKNMIEVKKGCKIFQ